MKSLGLILALAIRAGLPTVFAAETPPSDGSKMMPTEVIVIEAATSEKKKTGGGSSSIGTDAYDVRTQTAWFYGARPIVVCFNSIDSFGQSERRLGAAIEKTIKLWKDYFTSRKIVRGNPELSPDLNFAFKGKCKGDEDLVVFFGTGPIFANLSDLKAAQRLSYPAAYANKVLMSRDLKWSKGYIRIVNQGYYGNGGGTAFPDWRVPGALEAVLAHEFGHVLGFTHVSATIMRAELVDQVFSLRSVVPSIDGERQLVSCEDCQAGYKLSSSSGSPVFFKRAGLNPERRIALEAGKPMRLTDGKNSLPLTETSRTQTERNRVLWSNFGEPLNDSSVSYNLYGYITPHGEKVPLVVEFNGWTPQGTMVLRSLEGGEFREVGRFGRD